MYPIIATIKCSQSCTDHAPASHRLETSSRGLTLASPSSYRLTLQRMERPHTKTIARGGTRQRAAPSFERRDAIKSPWQLSSCTHESVTFEVLDAATPIGGGVAIFAHHLPAASSDLAVPILPSAHHRSIRSGSSIVSPGKHPTSKERMGTGAPETEPEGG